MRVHMSILDIGGKCLFLIKESDIYIERGGLGGYAVYI